MITIFTPTYNRAYIIHKLYYSLINQTTKDFEWLIVDDGSVDNTKEVINKFILENKINIQYHFKENGGKHRAINWGAQIAKGDLFFIVDSDDFLAVNAIERILFHYENIKENESFAGISGIRAFTNGLKIGSETPFDILDCSSIDFRFKYKIKGDMAEVIRTEILRKHPFPDFEGEKFCPESLVWNRIAHLYKFRYFFEKIYICEYLEDGLSKNSIKGRMNSPKYAMQIYSELARMNIPLTIKIKSHINYWRFAFCSTQKFREKLSVIGLASLIAIPFGYYLHIIDLNK